MPNSPRRLNELLQAMGTAQGGLPGGSAVSDRASGASDPQLLFLGNWQDPCPRRLLLDEHLEPVDIVTWQVIRVHAEPGKLVTFPAYHDLMCWVRVSRATVARAMTVLRLARWLPLCASSRDEQGRFRGNVYALTDEPLPLTEMLEIDGGYVTFTQSACQHRHAHVRRLAADVSHAIRRAARDPAADALRSVSLGTHLEDRVERMFTWVAEASAEEVDGMGPTEDHRVQNLNSVHGPSPEGAQNLNADRVRNLNSARSSSNNKNKTTTTTTTTTDAQTTPKTGLKPILAGPDATGLEFPTAIELTEAQRQVLALRFGLLPRELRQDVLDEAAARIIAKRRTADPVRCQFDYVARLVSRALEGEFTLTDAGARLRAKRDGQATAEVRLERARAHSEARRRREWATFQASRRGDGAPGSD